ncbi:MAG: efflux RND transporter periplasmic adaptor subunit [Acidobacteria bacterium]|nr:efflux RND transporter periplasmic adaptor subunit [Acidobacteriota bacterium]
MQGAKLFLLATFAVSMLTLSACSNSKANKTAKGEGGPEKEKAVPVQIVDVEARELRRIVESSGSLFAYDEVVVSSEVEGKCDKVLVDIGDKVTKGQTLVEIAPIELRLAAEQQEALLEVARAKLGLTDGSDMQDPTQAAAVKKAAADLANAQQKFQRTKELTEQGLLPKQTYDQDEAMFKAAQATYELAIQDVRNLQAALKERRSTSELAKKKLRDTKIVAPFNGYVKERSVTVGQYLRVQTPVVTIVNIDPIRVRLKVPEKMAGWIPIGQEVTVSVEAYPDRTFTGKIWRINPSVDQQTRTFDAEALIDNNQGLLKPGFFVKSTIDSNKVEHVLLVPQKALSYAYGIYKVFQVKGDKVKETEVRLGDRMGDDVEVVQGLSKGDRLAVANPDQYLRDGTTITEDSSGKTTETAGAHRPTS